MGQQTLTILLVEDDELLMMSFSDMLRDMGHEVFEAPTARQALSMLEQIPEIDVLITDIQMPDMNGVEVCMYLRGIRIADRCKVVSVSGGARAEDLLLLRQLGVVAFLDKSARLSDELALLLPTLV